MNLPDPQRLEDAQWQLDHATQQLAPLLAILQARLEPPTAAGREAYEQDQLLLRTLRYYFTTNSARMELMQQVQEEMDAEMYAANGRYREMRLERDFAVHEAQTANGRYYQETDLFKTILHRLTPANRA